MVAASAVGIVALVPLAACNALTGASDLNTCENCGFVPGSSGGVDGGGGGDDGSMVIVLEGGSDALPPTCTGSQTVCAGPVSAECVNNAWVPTLCPKLCDATTGKCADYPSCRNAAATSCAGAAPGVMSCCDTAAVPGGTFNRKSSNSFPATVSPFHLDRFEVTVGRMRAFVAAGGATQAAPPAAGAGANPKIPGSGWNVAWNPLLPVDVAALHTMLGRSTPTWTDVPGANERLPINNVSWFVAFAFCAWDGGRLPTYAEMNFASEGGSDQRPYPWSTSATDTFITRQRAAYNCNFNPPEQVCPASSCSDGTSSPCDTTTCLAPATCQYPGCTGCSPADIAPVGSLPTGAGKWGHFDLSGNIAELVYDTVAPLPMPCIDCVHAPPTMLQKGPGGTQRLNVQFVLTGGAWDYDVSSMQNVSTSAIRDDIVDNDVGFRCAR